MFIEMAQAASVLRNFWMFRQFFGGLQKDMILVSEAVDPKQESQDLCFQHPHDAALFLCKDRFEPELRYLRKQLNNGLIPSLSELLCLFPNGLDSAEDRYLLSRIRYHLHMLNQPGAMRFEQLQLTLTLRRREHLRNHLRQTQAKFSQSTTPDKELQACIRYVQRTIQDIEEQLADIMTRDSSHGGILRLSSPTNEKSGPFRPLFRLILELWRLSRNCMVSSNAHPKGASTSP